METKKLLITLCSLITESVNPYIVTDKNINNITSTGKNFYIYDITNNRDGVKVGKRVDFGSILIDCGSKEFMILLGNDNMNVVDYYNTLQKSIRRITKNRPHIFLNDIEIDTAKRTVELILHLNYTMMTIYKCVNENSIWGLDTINRALDMAYITLSNLIKIIEDMYNIGSKVPTVTPSSNRPRVTSLYGKLEDHLSTFPIIKDILKNIKDTPLDDMVMEAITIYEKHGDKAYNGTLNVLTAYKNYIVSTAEDELYKDLVELSVIGNTIKRYNSLKGIK